MARTEEQIRQSMKDFLTSINNQIDLGVGPTWDFLLSPVPSELASIESQVERLKRYYSPNFMVVATPQEAKDFSTNFSTGPNSGGYARGQITFYRNTAPPPGITYTVQAGTMVSNKDGSVAFRVITPVSMFGDYASTYFNPSTNRYEISTTIEAVSPGVIYNLPAGRVTKILTSLLGFDGAEQKAALDGGTEPEDVSSLILRIQDKFQGLDINSVNGVITTAKAVSPTEILDAKVVRPTDRLEFRRLTEGLAIDLYISGSRATSFTEEYSAFAGDLYVPITENRTATSITSVLVGGTALASTEWSFLPDTSLEYQASTRASPKIQLSNALSAGDVVEINGLKNSLLDDVQDMFYPSDNSLFKTDVLARSFIDLNVIASIEVKINSGDVDEIKARVTSIIYNTVEPLLVPTAIYPNTISDLIRSNIPEVTSVKIYKFKRESFGISDVEVIIPLKNQIPRFNEPSSSIVIRL